MLFQWGMRRQKERMNDGVQQEGADHSGEAADVLEEPLSPELAVNIDIIRRATGESSDIVIRRFSLGQETQMKAAIVFVDGLVDEKNVYEFLLLPLLTASFPLPLEEKERIQWIEKSSPQSAASSKSVTGSGCFSTCFLERRFSCSMERRWPLARAQKAGNTVRLKNRKPKSPSAARAKGLPSRCARIRR